MSARIAARALPISRSCSLVVRVPWGSATQRDHAEDHRGGGVGDEELSEVLFREEPADRQADREGEVEQQPVERVGRHAVLRRDEVGDQGTRGGTVQLREVRVDDDDREHRGKRPCLEQEQDQRGRRDHRDRDGVPASDPVRQQAPGELREHRSHPVAGDRQAGLGDREAVLGEVQREEREDEAPEPEHERAREQDPCRTRHRAEAVAEPWTPLDGRAHCPPGRWYPETEGGTSRSPPS